MKEKAQYKIKITDSMCLEIIELFTDESGSNLVKFRRTVDGIEGKVVFSHVREDESGRLYFRTSGNTYYIDEFEIVEDN